MTPIQQAILDQIKKYNLQQSDYFINYDTGEKIISGNGIRRIIFIEGLNISKDLLHLSLDGKIAVVSCKATLPHPTASDSYYTALGEASPDNNTFKYPINVAEKRAEARAVLNKIGLYAHGWRGEDEIDEKVEGTKIAEKRKLATTAATTATQEKINQPKKSSKALKITTGAPVSPGSSITTADNIAPDA